MVWEAFRDGCSDPTSRLSCGIKRREAWRRGSPTSLTLRQLTLSLSLSSLIISLSIHHRILQYLIPSFFPCLPDGSSAIHRSSWESPIPPTSLPTKRIITRQMMEPVAQGKLTSMAVQPDVTEQRAINKKQNKTRQNQKSPVTVLLDIRGDRMGFPRTGSKC